MPTISGGFNLAIFGTGKGYAEDSIPLYMGPSGIEYSNITSPLNLFLRNDEAGGAINFHMRGEGLYDGWGLVYGSLPLFMSGQPFAESGVPFYLEGDPGGMCVWQNVDYVNWENWAINWEAGCTGVYAQSGGFTMAMGGYEAIASGVNLSLYGYAENSGSLLLYTNGF